MPCLSKLLRFRWTRIPEQRNEVYSTIIPTQPQRRLPFVLQLSPYELEADILSSLLALFTLLRILPNSSARLKSLGYLPFFLATTTINGRFPQCHRGPPERGHSGNLLRTTCRSSRGTHVPRTGTILQTADQERYPRQSHRQSYPQCHRGRLKCDRTYSRGFPRGNPERGQSEG